jgi:hypothetical protein
MKYVKWIFLVAAVVFVFVGVYLWLGAKRIDTAALYLALSALAHGAYLQTTKLDKSG